MNQAEACRRQAQKIATTYPGRFGPQRSRSSSNASSEWPYLMEAATYWKEKRQADCLATLAVRAPPCVPHRPHSAQKYANTHAGAYQCRLALVQSHIANGLPLPLSSPLLTHIGELSQALDALLEVKPLCFKPAFVWGLQGRH